MMTKNDDNEFTFTPYTSNLLDEEIEDDSSTLSPPPPVSSTVRSSSAIDVITVDELIVNVHLKYAYSELKAFADELVKMNRLMSIGNRQLSTLQLYALKSTREPIDMSNQSVRKIYRPTLFIRKNDAFGPWNFNYLLNLMEIDYQCSSDEGFPKVWKTTDRTTVIVNIIQCKDQNSTNFATQKKDDTESATPEEESTTLLGVLIQICRQNKYDEKDANLWLRSLKEESITTLEHLRTIASNDSWEKISCIKHLPKQMIRDYIQLNAASNTFSKIVNPYAESEATLIGDIHRVRRYFYYVTDNLKHLSYLDRRAVDLAVVEVRRSYDDDGNVLNNIHNYLRTFCLKNAVETELKQLRSNIESNRKKYEECLKEYDTAETDTRLYSLRLENLARKRAEVYAKADQTNDKSKKIDFENEVKNIQVQLDKKQYVSKMKKEEYLSVAAKIDNAEKQIENLNGFLKLNVAEEHKKLTVKYGRGLLLYGPPGTGKSELLKRVAVYAGITMTTTPLAAGELNRPYVGETEKLLIDIMYRANIIPYLICAMTIDEIDGLVPKRDNNAQQSKVDGISVLLSHIEGVKNIPNLIVFGATNRRNMMDEAFLRRMQAKCFVGRPSPQIRKKMLRPLLIKDSRTFNSQRIDFLVKVTTNFSGAAVGALKSSIIVAMDNHPTLSDNELLELTDNAAREFSCWFGIGTLPEICRLHPNIFNSQQQEELSLSLPKTSPTGRILVDLQEQCNEYNRSMLIFDIDSLIMLNVSDSDMSKSLSISNITLYQFIREKCKTAIVEQKSKNKNKDEYDNKEKWIVMIVKHPLLRSLLIEDIEFKKMSQQIEKEIADEQQRLDNETEKKICRYHDGFVYDLDNNRNLTHDEAQCMMLQAKITNRNAEQHPKLIWACCLGVYGHDAPCQIGLCGLPEELKVETNIDLSRQDLVTLVQNHFMQNKRAEQKIKNFIDHNRRTSRNLITSKLNASSKS
ncbi:unnamed protein product [Rotaria magnacalcarata]|uniref:AAA+ ATPase domain-containing protein n=1 Tax=Rotaria magnacalcarata TaxID=392030 RepID=A0A819I8B5_9BILA|nr:unnamed protein product [Rotaria magnacalcarata]